MKRKYLNNLSEYLENKLVSESEIKEIVSEYSELYDEALLNGKTDETIIKSLGTPREIYRLIKDDLREEVEVNKKASSIASILALILFLVTGVIFESWVYGWLFFLIVPIVGILTTNFHMNKLPGIFVFISLIIYYIVGMKFGIWHPTWLVFLSIPIVGLLTTNEKINYTGVSVFVALIGFFMVGHYIDGGYKYSWLFFLIIPLFAAIFSNDDN